MYLAVSNTGTGSGRRHWSQIAAARYVALLLLIIGAGSGMACLAEAPSAQMRAQLLKYWQPIAIYSTAPDVNNLSAGLTHSWNGSGQFWNLQSGEWKEWSVWLTNRGYGSTSNVHEISAGWVLLALSQGEGMLTRLPAEDRYSRSWGQILLGLRTLRALQTSGLEAKYHTTDIGAGKGCFWRFYKTVDNASHDADLTSDAIEYDGNNEVAVDDQALLVLALYLIEGLADAQAIPSGDLSEVHRLAGEIRGSVDLRYFIAPDKRINMNAVDAVLQEVYFDRRAAEGSQVLQAMLLTGTVAEDEATLIRSQLKRAELTWTQNGQSIAFGMSNFHGYMFTSALRAAFLPVDESEFPGARYWSAHLKPLWQAHQAFAAANGFDALVGSVVMSQARRGVSTAGSPELYRFAGNEGDVDPISSGLLAPVTAPAGMLVPLERWWLLPTGDADKLLGAPILLRATFLHRGGISARP